MPRLSKIGAAALGAFGWTGLSSVTASYLVVAGGGSGGGGYYAGGGGAGGYLTGTTSLNPTLSYTVTVGAGAATVSGNSVNGLQGSNTTFSAIVTTAIGGGYGAGYGASGVVGGVGGSGGGTAANALATVAAGTSGQGNAGGQSSNNGGGGGGGAGSVGGNAGGSFGTGGTGSASSISGTSVTYAAGGAGGITGVGNGASGTANTGNGGAASSAANGTSGAGGSGVVIISYLGAQQFGGGVVTSSGGYTIHTFNTSGTLAPLSSLTASYLIVGGGGAGGGNVGGGGGAGGLLSGSGTTIDTNSTYLVTVGAGGTSVAGNLNVNGGSGTSSSFSMVTTTASGGGGGGGWTNNGSNGASGGGGGNSYSGNTSGGTASQGFAGGTSTGGGSQPYVGGGGGGAGAVGGNASGSAGAGGVGLSSSISGTATYYAGGGGGGLYQSSVTLSGGAGGNGGGGAGGGVSGGTAISGSNATANTGGGGGGASGSAPVSGNGGSGVVVISYAGATQQMAGGTVTISGGNVIHTFTSSGYLTPLKLVNNSLRFRSSASANLSKTFASAPTTRTKQTFSFWLKRGTLSVEQRIFDCYDGSSSWSCALYLNSSNQLEFDFGGSSQNSVITTQLFRDPAAWYHIVVAIDTTQATAANRIIFYVNGVQVTSYSATNYPAQNALSQWTINTANNKIASSYGNSNYLDGYLTEINFVDGQALTPNSFGTFNSYGVWQPITYGGSYGTNGFYLPFTNKTSTTTLGYDFSPQGNNWTPNNISLTTGSTYDSMTDVPTLTSATVANYPVMNPLDTTGGSITNGNLTVTTTGTNINCRASFVIPTTGKWYFETTDVVTGGNNIVGIANSTLAISASQTGATGSISTGMFSNAVYGFAFNFDALTYTIYKNNTVDSSGSITSGIAYSIFIATSSSGGASTAFNFGQQPFAYTPPSGFLALNTYNI